MPALHATNGTFSVVSSAALKTPPDAAPNSTLLVNGKWLYEIVSNEHLFEMEYSTFMALAAAIPIGIFVGCVCGWCIWCQCKKVPCSWRHAAYHCGSLYCRWLCFCEPLSDEQELSRGPDQAIDEHQDEKEQTQKNSGAEGVPASSRQVLG